MLGSALRAYEMDKGQLPLRLEHLAPKILEPIAIERWKQTYRFEINAAERRVFAVSAGPDEEFGTEDDITHSHAIPPAGT